MTLLIYTLQFNLLTIWPRGPECRHPHNFNIVRIGSSSQNLGAQPKCRGSGLPGTWGTQGLQSDNLHVHVKLEVLHCSCAGSLSG